MWIPLVAVGSMLFWALALSLGNMSLSALNGADEDDLSLPVIVQEPTTKTGAPIPVDVQTSGGIGGTQGIDDGTGRLPAIDESPPPPPVDPIGRTSY